MMAKSFNPGAFRHKIDFLSPPTERDEYGEPVAEWPIHRAGVYAAAEPLIGKELYAALTADTRVEVKFKLRYIPGVTNDMRIRHAGDIYDIISAVNPETRNAELVCYCRKLAL